MPFLATLGGGSQKGFFADMNIGFGKGISTNATVTEYTLNGITYRSHTFLTAGSSGTFNWTGAGNRGQQVDVLIVAGGGQGGGNVGTQSGGCGGGGGAGGVRQLINYPLADGAYTITVGSGGSGNNSSSQNGANGGNSSAFGFTLDGGGGGGWTDDKSVIYHGSAGGSGGGSAGGDVQSGNPTGTNSAGYHLGGVSQGGQGHAGGQGTGRTQGDYAGGGGGAGCAGHPGRDSVGAGSGGAGIRNNFRTGSAQYYAAGGGTGNGGSGNITMNNGQSSNGTGSYQGNIVQTHVHTAGPGHMGGSNMPGNGGGGVFSGGSAAANTGSGGGGANNGAGGPGGSGIVIVRYPIDNASGHNDFSSTASMENYQGLSAGNHDLDTDNGQGTMNLEIVDMDGRKWAKIPYSTETSGGTGSNYFRSNWLWSQQSYGNHCGEMCWDSSDRWGTYGYEENGYNINSHQVIFDIGIRYRYVKLYCTAIRSIGSSGNGPPNCDWGNGGAVQNNFGDDYSGGFGDHPFWIIGWDLDGANANPRYRGIDGQVGSGAYISGSTGGWAGGEQGDITRSFTSGTHDCGVDSDGRGYYHKYVGIGIAGGPGEVYRHNSGYFLIS